MQVVLSSVKSPPHAPRLYAEMCNACPQFNAIKSPDQGTVKQLLHYLGHLWKENMPKSMCLASQGSHMKSKTMQCRYSLSDLQGTSLEQCV